MHSTACLWARSDDWEKRLRRLMGAESIQFAEFFERRALPSLGPRPSLTSMALRMIVSRRDLRPTRIVTKGTDVSPCTKKTGSTRPP